MWNDTRSILLESCVDSVESAVAAEKGGAGRVELCANLTEGGTTPSAGMIALVRQSIRIGLQVMIRPRGGDFCYSDLEFEVMKYDIARARELEADGIVLGILTVDGQVDRERTSELVRLSRPLNVTFHRAFDMVPDPFQALEDLVSLGVDRLLTSGQENSALEGLELITRLVEKAAGRIMVMPGGGISSRNIGRICRNAAFREVHAGGALLLESPMRYRCNHISMGRTFRPPEYAHYRVSAAEVKRLLDGAVRNE